MDAESLVDDLADREAIAVPLESLLEDDPDDDPDDDGPGPIAFPDALARAMEAGRVEAWSEGDTLMVSLTPLEARRRKLVPDDTSTYWVPAARPSRTLRASRRKREVTATDARLDLEDVPARGDDARPLAILGKYGRAEVAGRPTVLLGQRPIWRRIMTAQPCAGCGGGKLPESHYCLVCDNWGLQHLLQSVLPSERPRYDPDGKDGGIGRRVKARKARATG